MKSERGKVDDGRVDALGDVFMSSYLDTQYCYVQFLTEHLADCAAAFGGDLDSVLIMAILGQRRLEAAREVPSTSDPEVSRIAMSGLRIADVSGIPRETVRRKLEILRGKGWVDQHPRHGWYIVGSSLATPARTALRSLEARSFSRLARLYIQLSDVLDRND
jgi:hypothetical protein